MNGTKGNIFNDEAIAGLSNLISVFESNLS